MEKKVEKRNPEFLQQNTWQEHTPRELGPDNTTTWENVREYGETTTRQAGQGGTTTWETRTRQN
jgi:hypothetical protein